MRTNIIPLLALPALFTSPATAKQKPKDAILLSEVQTLTLRANRQTSHRRVPAIPQLKCISSKQICALHEVDVMRCTNQGSSYSAEDIEWSCTASLPPELKLGATDVVCEGYAGPGDPYVLRGSCGVEYRLVLTDLGERRFPQIASAGSGGWFSGWLGRSSSSSSNAGGGVGNINHEPLRYPESGEGEGGSLVGAWLFRILFAGVFFWIVRGAWRRWNAPNAAGRRRRGNRWFGNGGGGGGFDSGSGPGGGGGDAYNSPPPYKNSSSEGGGGWRPGFWSGLAGGLAASYLSGNRRNWQEEPRTYNFYGGGGGSSSSSSWGSSSSGRSSDYGSGSTSSSRHISTGFGSTRRR
ncbi:hypothetical protein F5Y09DRAFT_311044 [Xylaria sp. FL1042]|nr:hypothetical protein F5Y09DRAFT_311044 [Xylaria sp. FL1042]